MTAAIWNKAENVICILYVYTDYWAIIDTIIIHGVLFNSFQPIGQTDILKRLSQYSHLFIISSVSQMSGKTGIFEDQQKLCSKKFCEERNNLLLNLYTCGII